MRHPMRKAFSIIIYIFAAIGFVLIVVYIAVQLGWTKTTGMVDRQHDYFNSQSSTVDTSWAQGEEWKVLKEAIIKDKIVIKKAATVAIIDPRLIVATLIVEQLRLFNDNREIFKTIFAPLKILGNQSQFSWGVMGIKQDTAIEVEKRDEWHMLDYSATTTDKDSERFARLTDEHDRYYSYLYAAVLLKETETQWQNAGFPISGSPQNYRPEILATLFNIGFANSKPNANPQVGGAEINIGTSTYSFGGLAGSFYYSNELLEEFPR